MRGYLLVAAGGVLGASARWGAGDMIHRGTGEFPWATLLVNLVGCLVIGVAAVRLPRGSLAWLFLVTGVLGGFTTFSAFAVETRVLVAEDRAWLALVYVVASLAGGIGATMLAERLAAPARSA